MEVSQVGRKRDLTLSKMVVSCDHGTKVVNYEGPWASSKDNLDLAQRSCFVEGPAVFPPGSLDKIMLAKLIRRI